MTGTKYQYLCTVLISLLAASVLISDVTAKSFSSSHHQTSHVSHSTHSSSSYSKPSTSHSYPVSSGHSGHSGGSVHSQHPSYPVSTGHSGSSGGSVNSQRPSYPVSTGHSGNSGGSVNSQHPSYPVSTGHSGSSGGSVNSQYPSYPAVTGHSGNSGGSVNSQHPSYPVSTGHSGSSGGSVNSQRPSYPVSTGHSGNSGGSVNSQYPSYPASTGHNGNNGGSVSGSTVHSYPPTNIMSGAGARPGNVPTGIHNTNSGINYQQNYPSINTHQTTSWNSKQPVQHIHTATHTVHHHHHYTYRPPTVIHYSTSYGASPVSYPIYTGTPPAYVYEYRSSTNKYRYLLAGLALYNLGKMSATPRANNYHQQYNPKPDEYCRFGVRHRTGAVEEMNIDCRAISYFIFEAVETQPQMQPQTHVSTNIVNQATVTTQMIYPNGSLVNTQTPVNAVNGVVVPYTQQILSGNGAIVGNTQQVNTVTTTTTQVLPFDHNSLKGDPVHVNSEMECYVTRITSYSNMQKPVPCGLLQEYAKSSFRRSSAATAKSSLTLILMVIAFLFY